MNPILKKELKISSRSIKLPLSLMFYNGVLAAIVLFILLINYTLASNSGINYSTLTAVFPVMAWVECGIIILIVPIITAGSIAGEREKQTLDIMLTTSIKPFSIVWGKLLASLSNVFMFIFSSLPILSISFIFGGLSWLNLFIFIIALLSIAIYMGSIGIFCSSVFKKTVISTIMTFLISIGLIIGNFIIFGGAVGIVSIVQYNYSGIFSGVFDSLNIIPLILLFNPLVNFFEFIEFAIGGVRLADLFESNVSTVVKWIFYIWIPLSLILNGAVSYLFLLLATRKINPIKKKKKAHKGQINNIQVNNMPMNNNHANNNQVNGMPMNSNQANNNQANNNQVNGMPMNNNQINEMQGYGTLTNNNQINNSSVDQRIQPYSENKVDLQK